MRRTVQGPNQGSPSGRSTEEGCLIAATERDMSGVATRLTLRSARD